MAGTAHRHRAQVPRLQDRPQDDTRRLQPRRCDPGAAAGYTSNLDLTLFLDADGLSYLLSWLSTGSIKGGGHPDIAETDLDHYVDFVRRVQTPYYEEARPRLRDEKTRHWLGDAGEAYPYLPDTLRRIAEEHPRRLARRCRRA
ncbi:MAG: hypothetical protein ACRDOO_09010 [Actinomadura sp.]